MMHTQTEAMTLMITSEVTVNICIDTIMKHDSHECSNVLIDIEVAPAIQKLS